MKIAVVGSGALGGFFGALFAQTGQDVTLVDVDSKKVESIRGSGLTVTTRERERTVRVPITRSTEDVGPVDLVFFSVKSYATLGAAQTLPPLLGADTLVMSIQNGIGNVEKIASVVGPERVVGGITAHSFQMVGPSHIRYVGGAGHMHIGKVRGENTPRVQEVAAVLRQGGVEVEVNDSIQDFIWYKLMVNTPINAIAAITRFKNGELAESEGVRQLMMLVADEALAVAKEEGIRFLGEGHPLDACLAALRAAAENKASMLQDVEAGRRTEIDAINGAIVERAARYGIAVPVNETLVRLVKVIEAKYLAREDPEARP
jgi:2-dehydropantoate 2-reductase